MKHEYRNNQTGSTGSRGFMPAHTREPWGLSYDSDLDMVPDNEVLNEGSDPTSPLPTFSRDNDWPDMLQSIVDKGETPEQRDIMLLGALTVLGATMGEKVRVMYGGKYYSPNMMLFVVAPPASGKGRLSLLRSLAQPFHDELLQQWNAQMSEYKRKKLAFDGLGKGKATAKDEDIPEQPVRKFFIIPGNNSGTGMQANVINSGGRGIIMEVEADTLSAALNADYGHFDDALRKFFDHEGICYYRRTDDESKEVSRTFVSVLLSGTPAQVQKLIPSSENGLFSRFIYYYMPTVKGWQSQFGVTEDQDSWFRQLGIQWKNLWQEQCGVGSFTLELQEWQKALIDDMMTMLFKSARKAVGDEGVSVVIRLAHHMLRMMMVVAMLRALEAKAKGEQGNLRPEAGTKAENVKDGIVSRYILGIGDDDFTMVLGLADAVLFRHSLHVLSMLPKVTVTNRGSADREALFFLMGEEFTRKAYIEKAGEMGICENTALTWLKRAMKEGVLMKVGRGVYGFKGC